MPCHHLSLAPTRLATRLCAGLAACLALAGCVGDTNPVRDLAIASGVTGGEPKPPPDFISRSRPGSVDYVPVGTSAPRRDLRGKTAAEVTNAEAELERVRTRNEARGADVRRNAGQ